MSALDQGVELSDDVDILHTINRLYQNIRKSFFLLYFKGQIAIL